MDNGPVVDCSRLPDATIPRYRGVMRLRCGLWLPSLLQLCLFLQLFSCVPVMILSVINSRPTTSSRPSNPLSASFLVPQIWSWLAIVCVYKLYLLTYLGTTTTVLQPFFRTTQVSRYQKDKPFWILLKHDMMPRDRGSGIS